MNYFASMVLLSSSVLDQLPVCVGADVQCFKLHLAEQALEIDKLRGDKTSLTEQLSLSSAAQKVAIDAATVANSYAQKIQAESQLHWYEKPVWWFALGFLAASAACIGLAAAVNHVTR